MPRGNPIPIKRVIRRGLHFLCGVCRKTYTGESAAAHCLEGCLRRWLGAGDTVNEVKEGAAKRYRCHFCKRIFDSKSAAKVCADACRAETESHAAAEQAIFKTAIAVAGPAFASGGEVVTLVAGKPRKTSATRRDSMHKFLRDGRKLICRKCGTEHASLDTVIACYDGHPVSEKKPRASAPGAAAKVKVGTVVAQPSKSAATATPDLAAATTAAAAAEKKPAAENDNHKFSRDGARYVCRNCKAKYFTRAEVGACFDKH